MTTDEALAVQGEEVITTLQAEVRRLREERDVYEPAAKNWPRMLKRCEQAEAERDAARAEVAMLRAILSEAMLNGVADHMPEGWTAAATVALKEPR